MTDSVQTDADGIAAIKRQLSVVEAMPLQMRQYVLSHLKIAFDGLFETVKSQRLSSSASAASQWRQIESAPRDGTRVLLYRPRYRDVRLGSWFHTRHLEFDDVIDERSGWHIDGEGVSEPTHWMPYVDPSQEQEERL